MYTPCFEFRSMYDSDVLKYLRSWEEKILSLLLCCVRFRWSELLVASQGFSHRYSFRFVLHMRFSSPPYRYFVSFLALFQQHCVLFHVCVGLRCSAIDILVSFTFPPFIVTSAQDLGKIFSYLLKHQMWKLFTSSVSLFFSVSSLCNAHSCISPRFERLHIYFQLYFKKRKLDLKSQYLRLFPFCFALVNLANVFTHYEYSLAVIVTLACSLF